MAMKRLALALVVGSGCTVEVVITPVIDTAINDTDADAFSGLEKIEISIAHEGDDVDLVSQSFDRGEALEIRDVQFGENLVIHLAGFVGSSQVAYGRTCAFDFEQGDALIAPHVFFSRTQKFARTDIAPVGRDNGHAVSFLGSGLFFGGTFEAVSARQIERFDPMTGELALVATVSERTGAVEALIGRSPPQVALIGGQVGEVGADFLELIDPNRRDRPIDDHPDGHLAQRRRHLSGRGTSRHRRADLHLEFR